MVQNDDSNFDHGDMLVVSTNQYVDAWFLDSVASYHMTPNKEWFTSYRSDSFSTVHLGDDKPCAITCISTIKIQLHDAIVRTLNNIRHILVIRNNLIFLGTLHANGFNYRSDDDRKILSVTKDDMILQQVLEQLQIKFNPTTSFGVIAKLIVGSYQRVY